ncbi:RmlC-like jelly roll [Corchorus olitorius]|uniref:RmlC-like jelly roll n=1 Tax=Corchorus olitorius TaxID=93759 RepID=A0A1R3ITP2_9ROSI|nr:RmlC-like jelly roll [Corchorus olitorius]
MPSPFPRWFGVARTWGSRNESRSSSEQDGPISNSIECYACTQVGVPVFHSTSCDSVHQPQWEAFAGSSLFPVQAPPDSSKSSTRARSRYSSSSGPFGKILDPRSGLVQRWNRVLLVARGIALAVDPLFFYTLTLIASKGGAPCVYLDGGLAAIVTVVRTCVDGVHLWHLWLQFRLAYVSKESLVVGCGKLVWDARAIASHYVRSLKGFWFDVFVILPAPQVTGGCWYVLATQRVVTCLRQQCERSAYCDPSSSCSQRVCSQHLSPDNVLSSQCGGNSTTMTKSFCFDPEGPFRYGIYGTALPVISSNSLAVKILYPIFWGLLNLSTFGNALSPTSDPLEVVFSICIVLGGLLLFTLLIGNIQVFLHVVMANRKNMQLRHRDVEWWMRRRQLPSGLRQRVRHFESQTWDKMGGEEEMKWIEELPEGLRRDIKRYLCLDLIKKVPLFHSLDDLILDNICDRIKPLIYSNDEKVM